MSDFDQRARASELKNWRSEQLKNKLQKTQGNKLQRKTAMEAAKEDDTGQKPKRRKLNKV